MFVIVEWSDAQETWQISWLSWWLQFIEKDGFLKNRTSKPLPSPNSLWKLPCRLIVQMHSISPFIQLIIFLWFYDIIAFSGKGSVYRISFSTNDATNGALTSTSTISPCSLSRHQLSYDCQGRKLIVAILGIIIQNQFMYSRSRLDLR